MNKKNILTGLLDLKLIVHLASWDVAVKLDCVWLHSTMNFSWYFFGCRAFQASFVVMNLGSTTRIATLNERKYKFGNS